MIAYRGYEELIGNVYGRGQDHVFAHWNELSDSEKKILLEDLSSVDFDLLERLFAEAQNATVFDTDFSPAPYIPQPATDAGLREFAGARSAGEEHIRRGKTAAFVVAGGQGTRLGYDGPKGMFSIGPVSGKSLFQVHAEKIVKYSEKYGVAIPWLIMTSVGNHEATVSFLEKNGNFGISPRDLFIFSQNMIPSLDSRGRLILEEKNRIFKNPDGHGGSLTALRTSGVLDELAARGIETISYFQVDNPLVKIIDPVFMGFHVLRGADISSKGLTKTGPGEKIGVFAQYKNGRMGVVEYSDLPADKAAETGPDGRLRFLMGSPAIHLFRRSFVGEITSGGKIELPYHVARKKIRAHGPEGGREIDGFKFEKFVFDALPLTEKSVVLEMVREEEFAPVKNPSGVDSVESARELMNGLYLAWLRKKGIEIPDAVKTVEISPLVAVCPEDLGDLALPRQENVYLG
jgi:UDP-N-acetylglucosamine/UDP-N-acetylgalactosamine diphosphorylase